MDQTAEGVAPRVESAQAGSADGAAAAGMEDHRGIQAKIKFKNAAGAELFALKPETDGAKLIDPQQRETARFNYQGGKLKIKDSQDKVLGYVVGSDGRYHLKSPDQSTVLYELQRQPDGDWKLEDGREQLIHKIKRRDYGYEIEAADERSLSKVKRKDGKLSLRGPNDETLLSTRDPGTPISTACFGLTALETPAFQAGFAVMLLLHRAE